MSASLSIVIYKGSPLDASEFRHTALFVEHSDGSSLLLHIVGTTGMFQPQVRQNENPATSKTFIRKIVVANIQGQTKDAIQSRVMTTPIQNSDKSWNCQNWVGDVLTGLSKVAWISAAARRAAVDTMADVITDAPDES